MNIEQLLALAASLVFLGAAVVYVRNFVVAMLLVTCGLSAWVFAGGVDALRAMMGVLS